MQKKKIYIIKQKTEFFFSNKLGINVKNLQSIININKKKKKY